MRNASGIHRCLVRGMKLLSVSKQSGYTESYAQLSGRTTVPAAPSWLAWLLRAGGAGVGVAAGALAHSGMGMWDGSSPAPLSSSSG